MISKSERLLIFRFLFSKKSDGYVSIFAWFSIIGISLGVAAIIIVMSVMNGFRIDLTNRIIGLNSHLNIYSFDNEITNNIKIVEREIIALQRKKRRRDISENERRKRRTKTGVKTIGLIGYSNAGKSSLFHAMAGKPVLIENQLFSTLETTIGRMQKSPRILMVDTIGFVDKLPTVLLDSFKSTIKESIISDLILLIIDGNDEKNEFIRKLETTLRELEAQKDNFNFDKLQTVITKCDLVTEQKLNELCEVIKKYDLSVPIKTSSVEKIGVIKLRNTILSRLFGKPISIDILPPTENNHDSQSAIIANLYDLGHVIKETKNLHSSISSLKSSVPSKVIRIKLNEVANLLNQLGKKHVVQDKDVLTMLRYYELVNELKNVGGK